MKKVEALGEFVRQSLSTWVATQKQGLVQEKQEQTRRLIEELTLRDAQLQGERMTCQKELDIEDGCRIYLRRYRSKKRKIRGD